MLIVSLKPNTTTTDRRATLPSDLTTLPDGCTFAVHPGRQQWRAQSIGRNWGGESGRTPKQALLKACCWCVCLRCLEQKHGCPEARDVLIRVIDLPQAAQQICLPLPLTPKHNNSSKKNIKRTQRMRSLGAQRMPRDRDARW